MCIRDSPIPFLFLGHLQPCTKKLKRKLKLQSTFKGNKMQVFSTASKTSVATTDAIFDRHDSSGNLVTMYGYHQKENTGSRLFTESKPCWTGMISVWMSDHLDKIPCAVLLGKSGWRSGHQWRLLPLLQCCMWIEFQSISTWLRGFSRGTPVSSLIKIDS